MFVTFRLEGSLPQGRHFPIDCMSSGQAFVHMDRLLDAAGSGPTYLHDEAVALSVSEHIRAGDGERYDLHEWVIMPNHVHLLVTPWCQVSWLLQTLKGRSARDANMLLARSGAFWQGESYDRLVRDAEEFRRIGTYIALNPVRAGLAKEPELYRWSGRWAGLKAHAG